MPTIEGLAFSYALHMLPPGRFPLRRWRWELWHGSNLVAAGWRLARPDAARALRVAASEFAHRLFGLTVPPRDPTAVAGDMLPGVVERVAIGPTTCVLAPRALETPRRAVAVGSLGRYPDPGDS